MMSCNNSIKYPVGGYDYAENSAIKDTSFYFYPLRNIVSKRDSIRCAFESNFFNAFNEPNLSLSTKGKDIFRFTFEGFKSRPVIITLVEAKIIIKEGYDSEYYNEDETKLTEVETLHRNLLQKYFPINSKPVENPIKKYLDSVIQLYPQLLDSKYYYSLINKTIVPLEKPFAYKTHIILLSKEKYDTLINIIDASGYWSLPYKRECENETMDGYGFTLEANTQRKYNIVFSTDCPGDTTKFTKACQKLIEYANMDKKINLIWNWPDTLIAH